jgi:hypothetical protein
MDGIPCTPESAAAFVEHVTTGLPELIVHSGNLPATAEALRDLLAASGRANVSRYVGRMVPAATRRRQLRAATVRVWQRARR